MRYLSVCSGIEAATVAWHYMGWQPAAFSEIDKFPSQVLSHHYPDVPNVGDMAKYKEWNLGTIDLLVGGTPCQSFSVAGLRKGLDDPRGNLALVYCGILDHFRSKWFVWENVPGVLSSNGGRDFGSFLGALAQLGYGFAYRVLDAQWFGVAQRRRRVFVVGCLGDWRRAAAVLFERESLSRNPAPSREKGKEVAGTVTTRSGVSSAGGIGTDEACSGYVQPVAIQGNLIGRDAGGPQGVGVSGDGVMYTLTKADVHGVAQPIPLDLRNAGRDPEKHDAMNRQGVGVGDPGDPAHTVTTACVHGVAQPIAFHVDAQPDQMNFSTETTASLTCSQHAGVLQPVIAAFKGGQGSSAGGIGYSENVAPTLPSNAGGNTAPTLLNGMAVRRLTPVECERLQGFPDNYTNIKENCPDGPRYKALGNSMAVPVMKWIGERIEMVDKLC